MTLHLRTTPYGPPALAELSDAIRQAKHGEPLAPVTVVVPSNHVGVTVRRLLARSESGALAPGGLGTIGITFLTPYRMAELLGSARLAGAGRRPVTAAVIAAALRRAMADEPGVFEPVAEHPATTQALVAAYQELTDLSAPALDDLATASPRASDTVRIYRAARAHLVSGWYDEGDLVDAALAGVEAATAAGFGQVLVYLPQELTRRSARLLSGVAAHTDTLVLAGLTGEDPADQGVQRSLARLGLVEPTGSAPTGPASGTPDPAAWPVSAEGTRIVTTSDPEEEVRVAIDAVVGAARDGVALERMAVLFPSHEPYARLLHEHLSAAGLPTNGTGVRSLAECTYGRALLQLLGLAHRDYRRTDVLDLLTSAPVRRPAGSPAPTSEWERLSREAAVVSGRRHWDRRLADHADRLDGRAEVIETDQPSHERDEARSAHLRRRAGRGRDLRQLVLALIDALDEATSASRPWAEHVRWLRRTDGKLHGGEASRRSWPADERLAAERVEAALDRLAALDDVDEPCSLEVFTRTLETELAADLGRTGRFGEGILVAPLSFGVGLDLDVVVIVGLAEGSLPARLGDDSLLPDHERRQARGELSLRRDHAQRQHRQLRATLASARRQLLTAPRGDLRASRHRSTSRWLAGMVTGAGLDENGTVEDQPSFAHRVGRSPFPATEQEYRLRWSRASGPPPLGKVDDAVVAAGAEMIAGRQSATFTRYDGNLAGVQLRSPTEQVVSATRLETWADCPHAYLMRHLLGIEPVEDPEEQLQISALDKGSLVHEVLERFIRAVLPDSPVTWNDEHRLALREVGVEICATYEARGLVGRQVFWQRDRARILAMLDRFLDEDEQERHKMAAGGPPYRSAAAELAFGMPGADLGPVEVPLPDGRKLAFRGSADRVDRTDDGQLLVIDYKTARPDRYRTLSATNPDDHGRRLQLPVYGFAARAHQRATGPPGEEDSPDPTVHAQYWFVNERSRLTTIGYEVTDDVITQVGKTLLTIADGISAGVFPARPTETTTDRFVRCHYCNPDGLGVGDRKRAWERKKTDPTLTAYARLVEPDAEPGPEASGRTKAAA